MENPHEDQFTNQIPPATELARSTYLEVSHGPASEQRLGGLIVDAQTESDSYQIVETGEPIDATETSKPDQREATSLIDGAFSDENLWMLVAGDPSKLRSSIVDFGKDHPILVDAKKHYSEAKLQGIQDRIINLAEQVSESFSDYLKGHVVPSANTNPIDKIDEDTNERRKAAQMYAVRELSIRYILNDSLFRGYYTPLQEGEGSMIRGIDIDGFYNTLKPAYQAHQRRVGRYDFVLDQTRGFKDINANIEKVLKATHMSISDFPNLAFDIQVATVVAAYEDYNLSKLKVAETQAGEEVQAAYNKMKAAADTELTDNLAENESQHSQSVQEAEMLMARAQRMITSADGLQSSRDAGAHQQYEGKLLEANAEKNRLVAEKELRLIKGYNAAKAKVAGLNEWLETTQGKWYEETFFEKKTDNPWTRMAFLSTVSHCDEFIEWRTDNQHLINVEAAFSESTEPETQPANEAQSKVEDITPRQITELPSPTDTKSTSSSTNTIEARDSEASIRGDALRKAFNFVRTYALSLFISHYMESYEAARSQTQMRSGAPMPFTIDNFKSWMKDEDPSMQKLLDDKNTEDYMTDLIRRTIRKKPNLANVVSEHTNATDFEGFLKLGIGDDWFEEYGIDNQTWLEEVKLRKDKKEDQT